MRGGGGVARSSPLSMAITEFHFLLLFPGRLQVVSRLNGVVVQVKGGNDVLFCLSCPCLSCFSCSCAWVGFMYIRFFRLPLLCRRSRRSMVWVFLTSGRCGACVRLASAWNWLGVRLVSASLVAVNGMAPPYRLLWTRVSSFLSDCLSPFISCLCVSFRFASTTARRKT